MTSAEFVSWAEGYCKVFGLSNEEAETVLSWEPYFLATEWHADDLAEVTKAFVANPKEIGRIAGDSRFDGKTTRHLAAIEGYLREQTARTLEPPPGMDRGTCLVCSSTGFVVVPHLKGVRANRWVGLKIGGMRPQFYTCAVLCMCALGRWKAQRQGGQRHGGREVPKAMTLEAYEHENPAWKEQMEARQSARLERVKLAGGDAAGEVKALAERFKIWRAS